MLVYTFDEEVRDKLLNSKQPLVKEQELNGKIIYVFKINDLSLFKRNLSREENSRIFTFNNKMTF